MKLEQLEAVVAIAETGSFRKAADRLKRSQPTMTKSIKALEETINIVVFDRTPRGVRLTEHGKRIYARAKTVLADVQALEDEIAQMAGRDGGTIRVGVAPVGGAVVMPRALRQFRRKWPRVEVEVVSVIFPQAISLLREAAIDLAIGPVPPASNHGTIAVEPLIRMDVVVAAHAANPKRNVTRLSDLADEHWVVFGPKGGPSDLFSGTHGDGRFTAPKAFTRCDSVSSTASLIAEMGAFCFLSRPVAHMMAKWHEIVIVPIADDFPSMDLNLLLQKTRPLTPAATDLVKHIRRRAVTLSLAEGAEGSIVGAL